MGIVGLAIEQCEGLRAEILQVALGVVDTAGIDDDAACLAQALCAQLRLPCKLAQLGTELDDVEQRRAVIAAVAAVMFYTLKSSYADKFEVAFRRLIDFETGDSFGGVLS